MLNLLWSYPLSSKDSFLKDSVCQEVLFDQSIGEPAVQRKQEQPCLYRNPETFKPAKLLFKNGHCYTCIVFSEVEMIVVLNLQTAKNCAKVKTITNSRSHRTSNDLQTVKRKKPVAVKKNK